MRRIEAANFERDPLQRREFFLNLFNERVKALLPFPDPSFIPPFPFLEARPEKFIPAVIIPPKDKGISHHAYNLVIQNNPYSHVGIHQHWSIMEQLERILNFDLYCFQNGSFDRGWFFTCRGNSYLVTNYCLSYVLENFPWLKNDLEAYGIERVFAFDRANYPIVRYESFFVVDGSINKYMEKLINTVL